jgi:hypothetical protein
MELVIPGLLLVALMVYLSTRIKRNAAQAFEQEIVETDDFSLTKPEGFLHLMNGDPAFVFQAYSKEFGKNGSGEKRQATIDIRKITGKTFEEVCEDLKGDGTVLDNKNFQLDEMRASSVEIEHTADGIETVEHYLMIEAPASVFEIHSSVLKEHNADYARKIDVLEESFVIKK